MRPMLASAFVLSMCLAGTALAETQATAPAATPLTADQQIDAYLRSSPALTLPSEEEIDALQEERERKVHGEVSVAVGSHGYRDLYARSDMPVGKTGTLSLAVRDSRFNGRFGTHDRQGVAVGLSLGGATSAAPRDCRWIMDHDTPAPGRDEGRRCDVERFHRGPSTLGRPMF